MSSRTGNKVKSAYMANKAKAKSRASMQELVNRIQQQQDNEEAKRKLLKLGDTPYDS